MAIAAAGSGLSLLDGTLGSLAPGPTYHLPAATPSNQTPRGIGFFDLAVVCAIEPAVRLAD
jgi:hypothetical protein